MGQITNEQRERRTLFVLSFIFLFRFVTVKDLSLLGASFLGINDMRGMVQMLIKNKYIKSFKVDKPVKTVGYYLLDDGLAKLPKSLLEYEYFFYPKRYKPSTFYHVAGIIEVFLSVQKLAPKGAYWVSEWMVRQKKIKDIEKKVLSRQLGWRKKGVYGGRLPDGLFVVGKKARIAIEYESTEKSSYHWERMINSLENGLRLEEKLDLVTLDSPVKRDFEAVLFVFDDHQTFISYLRRFDKYSKNGDGVVNESVSLKRYFLCTLDELKKGNVFRAKGEKIGVSDMFGFVENGGSLPG